MSNARDIYHSDINVILEVQKRRFNADTGGLSVVIGPFMMF